MALGDRLRTIAATAIVTSVAWILVGGGLLRDAKQIAVARQLETVPGAPAEPGSTSPRIAPPLHGDTPVAQPAGAPGAYLIPVAGIRPDQLSDTFTDARGGGTRVHEAIDIMAPRGTPVMAAAAGTIEKLFNSQAGGLTVYIRSLDRRTITYYAHLDAYAPGLAPGQRVARGQKIGTVGYSGNADPAAPHLHFAVMQTTPEATWSEPATAINPYPLLTGRGR